MITATITARDGYYTSAELFRGGAFIGCATLGKLGAVAWQSPLLVQQGLSAVAIARAVPATAKQVLYRRACAALVASEGRSVFWAALRDRVRQRAQIAGEVWALGFVR